MVLGERHPRWLVVSAVGLAQVLVWGTTYYLIAVLARPIEMDTGWSYTWIAGGLSFGFLVSGLVSPFVGRQIERFGGRPVLSAGAFVLALGMVLLGTAPNVYAYLLAWTVLGVGMGAGLYDPAFAALGRLYGDQARGAITLTTLWGGFASTLCWPLSQYLVSSIGWRGTCLTYAVLDLAVVAPLYWFGLPAEPSRPAAPRGHTHAASILPPRLRLAFWLIATNTTISAVVTTVMSVHLIALLQARGASVDTAVALGTLIGPAQVGARLIEMWLARKRHPVWTMLIASILPTCGLALLFGAPAIAAGGILLYGSGSGLRSIARGSVPLAIFGRDGYATLMGRIAMPALIFQAAAPALGAVLLNYGGSSGTLLALVSLSALNILFVLPLLRHAGSAAGTV
jgi:predicted MFS family arabinose efflux permease